MIFGIGNCPPESKKKICIFRIVPSNIRNESYYMATNHDTWNAAQLKQHMLQSAAVASRKENAPPQPLECPAVHQRAGEALMIEQVMI